MMKWLIFKVSGFKKFRMMVINNTFYMSFWFGIYTKPARNFNPTLFETGVSFADQFFIFIHPFKFSFFLFILCVISSHCVIVDHPEIMV